MSGLTWGGEEGDTLAISYSSPHFLGSADFSSCDAFLFSLRDPTTFSGRLWSESCVTSVQFQPQSGAVVGGGCQSGAVCCWDTRLGGVRARSLSSSSHSDTVLGLAWTTSKTSTEMMTASRDGTVKFWDIRHFSRPLNTFILDLDNKDLTSPGDSERAQSISFLEFTSTIPSMFSLGTEGGGLVTCSRKARSQPETMTGRFSGHCGAVRYIERNPAFSKGGSGNIPLFWERFSEYIQGHVSDGMFLRDTWSVFGQSGRLECEGVGR